MVLEVGPSEPWDQRFVNVKNFHRHGLGIGETQSLHPHDPGVRRDRQLVGQASARQDGGQLEGPVPRHHAAAPHVVAERREGQRLGDLGFGDVSAAAVPALEIAVANQVIESRPYGQARDTKITRQLSFGGNRVTDVEAFDQVQDPISGVFLLVHSGSRRPQVVLSCQGHNERD